MSSNVLSAREVCQLLKDIALGVRVARRAADEISSGGISILVDGWHLTLSKEDGQLDHCAECVAPDGRASSIDSWHRHGSDPLQLLSRWEREELERLLS